MPRILLSTAHITPLVLKSLDFEYSRPLLASPFPPLPQPFQVTAERVERLQYTDTTALAESYRQRCKVSAKKAFCNTARCLDYGAGMAC